MAGLLESVFSIVLDIPEAELSDDTKQSTTRQWDSLASMHLVAAIETTFNVRLSSKDIARMDSIGAAREVLLEKKEKL